MEREELFRRIVTALEEIDYIVVGGYAWEKTVMPAGTVDLDIMIIPEEYKEGLRKVPDILREAGLDVVEREEDPIMSLFEVSSERRIMELEVINSRYYSTGKKEFFRYAKQYRTTQKNGIYYADPELVWYMRLYLPDWETYLYKCVRELTIAYRVKGYTLKLSNILKIANVLGTIKKIKPRVKVLEKLIERLE